MSRKLSELQTKASHIPATDYLVGYREGDSLGSRWTGAQVIAPHNTAPDAHGMDALVGKAATPAAARAALGVDSLRPIADARKRLAKSPSVFVLGDSLCSGNSSYPNREQNTKGWGAQVVAQSNGVLKLRWNGGVPSETTTQMLARISDVTSRAPNLCVIIGGRNDINTSVATATIVGNIDAMASTCLANGIIPVIGLVPPSSSGAVAALTNLNSALSLLCTRKGYTLADTYTPFINANGTQKTEYFEDSMHFNESGAVLAGITILQAAGWAAGGCSFIPNCGYAYGNLIANPDFTGGVSGSPGTMPTGWYKIGNPTVTFARDANGVNWCTLTPADGSNVTIGVNLSAVVAGNAEVIFALLLENAVSAVANDISAYLQFYDGATYKNVKLLDGVVANATGIWQVTSSAIAGNTTNCINFTVKPGKSIKFACPFVSLL